MSIKRIVLLGCPMSLIGLCKKIAFLTSSIKLLDILIIRSTVIMVVSITKLGVNV